MNRFSPVEKQQQRDLCQRQGQESLRVFVARFYLLFFLLILMVFMGRGSLTFHWWWGTPEGPHCPAPLVQCTPSILTCSHQRFLAVNFSWFVLFSAVLKLFPLSFSWEFFILLGTGDLGGGRFTNVALFSDGLFDRHLKSRWPSELLLMRSLHSEIFCLNWNWFPSNN